mgnify:FL=1
MSLPAYTNHAKPYNKGSSMSAAKQSYQYIMAFRQQAAMELGMANVNQALILELLSIASEWATPEYVDGTQYHWTARQKICAELPLLDLKPDTVARYLKSLVQLGLIEHIKSGKKDLTRITDKALSYFGKKSDIANDEAMSEKIPEIGYHYVGKNSLETTEKNPTYQYNYINQYKDNTPLNPPQGDVIVPPLASQSHSEPAKTTEPASKPAEPKAAKRKPAEIAIDAPETVNQSAWTEFVQHRKDIRKPLTEKACEKLFKLLAQFDAPTQQAMIDKSIESRWTGIFELKNRTNPNYGNTASDWNKPLEVTPEFAEHLQARFLAGQKRRGEI